MPRTSKPRACSAAASPIARELLPTRGPQRNLEFATWGLTDMGPLAHRCDGLGSCEEFLPGVAGRIDDIVIAVEDTIVEPVLAHMYCQTFSTGFSSGARGGRMIGVMLSGMLRFAVVCHPVRSMTSTAWAPFSTSRLISLIWSCMASVSANGSARAGPVPRAGQMAPNR